MAENMRFLGVDYGTKRVGLAISDETGRVAFPYGIFDNDSTLVSVVRGVVEKEGVGAVVVGESQDLRGSDNLIMGDARHFVGTLQERMPDLPVYFEPEYFTSAQARRGREDATQVDAQAATIILQSYIDRRGKYEV